MVANIQNEFNIVNSQRERPKTSISTKHIVIDLDECLVHTFNRYGDYADLGIGKKGITDENIKKLRHRTYVITESDITSEPGRGVVSSYWGITRNYVYEFLLFCYQYFETVTVWSAGKYRYVHSIVDHLFKNLPYPDLILTRDDLNAKNRKPLSTVFQKLKSSHPDIGYHNTWLLDDNNHNYIYDNPDNGILIPPFSPSPNIKDMNVIDNRLLQLKAWLEWDEVKESRDVRQLNTKEIFLMSLEELESLNDMGHPVDLSAYEDEPNPMGTLDQPFSLSSYLSFWN